MGYNILIATMSLDIGGAETHVLELATGLGRLGHSVTVVSSGGVYADELMRRNIEHITLPLDKKGLASVIKSYTSICSIIRSKNIDIIHAHARIPAFLCGFAARRYNVRFVTTCHAMFSTAPYFRIFSDWGERCLAVSYDIKRYLSQNYSIFADNIIVTVNGIDTDKFSGIISETSGVCGKGTADCGNVVGGTDTAGCGNGVGGTDTAEGLNVLTDRGAVEDLLSLPHGKKRVIYVSRIDNESSRIGFLLAEIAAEAAAAVPEIEFVFVGDGTAYERLSTIVDEVNSKACRPLIRLLGSRTDVHSILACGDVFIGVSRSALEAMSSKLPVVLGGDEGYIGIFDDATRRFALDTNFTCRGLASPDSRSLLKDIVNILTLSDSERECIGRQNRSFIVENYSVAKMVRDAVEVYDSVSGNLITPHGDIILSGYYGFGNTGDDSLLSVILNRQRKLNPNVRITVLSKRPRLTQKMYGVRCINRFNLLKISREMKTAKLLMNGGGSLLQNSTSNRSLLYYILIMRMAKDRGLKLVMYGSGIGPLYGERSRRLVRNILNKADRITLREDSSAEELCEIGVVGANISVTADPAFLMNAADSGYVDYLLEQNGAAPLSIKKRIVISLRSWEDADDNFVSDFVSAIINITSKHNLFPIFVPMHSEKDDKICAYAALKTGGCVINGLSASELIALLKSSELAVGMRLHMLIYGAAAGIPVVGISYDPKIDAFIKTLDGCSLVSVKDFSASELERITELTLNNRAEIVEKINHRTENLRRLALSDAMEVNKLLS